MNNKIEIKDTSEFHECCNCSSTGMIRGSLDENMEYCKCFICQGTGKCREESFILIAEQSEGQKIAFDIDNLGK